MTTAAPPAPPSPPALGQTAHRAAMTALVLGGFAIGTTEFVTMGLLPEIAEGIGVSIPEAGHTISAYAIGVVVGAPTIAVLGTRVPRRAMLVALMAAFVVGNTLSALATSYPVLFGARMLAGLPHGAFFAVASIVAVDLAAPGRGGRAVSQIMLGIPFATVVGVPVSTWMGQELGWRSAYWGVTAVGLVTAVLVLLTLPYFAPEEGASVRTELRAFRSLQVWLTLLVGAIGFGGMFSMYSYISPMLREETGVSASTVPLYLLVFGVAGVIGTIAGGRLADRSVLRTVAGSALSLAVALLLVALSAGSVALVACAVFLASASASVFVLSLQLRLMAVAGSARTLGAAGNHAALNTANALGAWLGGLVVAAGYGWRAPSAVGALLATAGLLVLGVSLLAHRRDTRAQVVPRTAG
ncbi:MFS transporter [Janibacter melonis]|uniref:MFS transporter n=1 Tax=Janibacter melonis TaxID=262209 RepID=UPI00204390B6|nr:MFS transporter [Janibacter melonis]MCM3556293.1 MFS transporter [Janibacter melonis]